MRFPRGRFRCAGAGPLAAVALSCSVPALAASGALEAAAVCAGPPEPVLLCPRDADALPDHGGQQPIGPLPEMIQGELPLTAVVALSPGTDTSLCMSWEPTIAVDPNNPRTIAVAQFTTIQVSFDGGATFPATVAAPATNPGGDPSLAVDSQGRLFLTYLCSPGGGRDVCISGYACNAGTSSCALLPGSWPVNVAVAAGIGGNNADKEWLAADANAASAFASRLYVVWTRLDTNPWSLWATWSDGGQVWSAAQQLSANDEGTVWPSHVAVGADGSVYAAWHSQTGFLDPSGNDAPDGVSGQVVLRRSADGGVTWLGRSFPYGPGQSDMSYNVQHEANGAIPGANMWLQGSLQPWILPDPLVPARVFVVANDDPDNDPDQGDAADVFMVISNDSGATWSAPARVDQGPAGTFQVMPSAAINPVNGAIGVTYYDNRALADADGDGVFELDLMGTSSTDGGLTWSPEVDFNDGRIDPAIATTCRFCGGDGVANQTCGTPACPAPGTTRIGEYNGAAYGECTLHVVWADDATCNGDYDTFYDRDPELGGDAAAPAVACPPPQQVGCNDPLDPAATGSATATDVCDLDPALSFADLVQPGNCPPGVVREVVQRTWTATDAAGNASSCEQTISVVDADPPVVTAPPPLALECNAPGGVPGNDPQVLAWLAQATAVDECGTATLTHDVPALLPAGCPPAGTATVVTFTGTDECGTSAFASSSVTVTDTTSPQVACGVARDSLWPPNHKFVDVGFTYTAADVCDTTPLSVAITVTSDEDPSTVPGAGGTRHCPDAIVGPDGSVRLRAERSGPGDGRVYRITVTATDSCGNAAACSVEVQVRHDRRRGSVAVDSGQSHDALTCN
jgi:hypothetical protein